MKFNKDMTMGEILAANPDARAILEGFGMHCCGCPVSQAEVLEEACEVHGIDVEDVLKELNSLEAEPCGCGCGDSKCTCGEECDCTPEDNCGCDCGEEKKE